MNHDSSRLYASDDRNKVIALDRNLNLIWEVDVGSKILASIAASQDNNEIYAATEYDIFKLVDHGWCLSSLEKRMKPNFKIKI